MVKKLKKKRIEISLDEFKSRIKTADLNTFFIFGAIVLVLGIGLYAIFSPIPRNARRGNPACGKIVVAADKPSLKANVSHTLSGARYFLVINPLSKKLLEAVKNPYAGMENPGSDAAYFIAGKGEEAVIAGSVDPQCYRVLTQFGIRAFGGYNGKVNDAVALYRQARISQGLSSANQEANLVAATQAAFDTGQYVFRCPGCSWRTNRPGNLGMCPICPKCGITTIWDGPGWTGNNFKLGRQAAFGFGKQAFICPACNWRMRAFQQGNGYPNCPNCGIAMAKDISNKGWKGWPEWVPFATVVDTVPVHNNPPIPQGQPNFWQGPESMRFFVCPNCNWRMYAQRDMGQFPRCPNCKAIMARGGAYYQNRMQNTQTPVFANNTLPAPPIYPNATMPHSYRGVCSNCHQILQGPRQDVNNQATWGGRCILR